MRPIVDIQLGRLRALLRDKHLELDVREAACALLAEAGYNPLFGARPLVRVIQTRVQDPLAEQIVAGTIAAGQTVVVDAADGQITIAPAASAAPAAAGSACAASAA
jgi:ATP-dependent Clp protease ATP-binding subunit ClpB